MRFIPIALVLAATASTAWADRPGEDHPLLPRYAGAAIKNYRPPAEDQVVLPIARIDDATTTRAVRTLEGRVTHIDYATPTAVPTLAVGRYYTGLLQRAGYRTVFDCTGTVACGKDMGRLIFLTDRVAPDGFADGLFGNRMRVIVAQRGDDWVLLHLFEGPDRTTISEVTVDKGAAGAATGEATASAAGGTGPKVHTSKARDVTDCSKTVNGGMKAAYGMALGGLLGSKIGGGGQGAVAASAAGGAVGAELDKQHRCGPGAQIESNAATDTPPEKPKKRSLGGLRNALGL